MMASWDEQKELMGGGAGHGDAQGILRALLWSCFFMGICLK